MFARIGEEPTSPIAIFGATRVLSIAEEGDRRLHRERDPFIKRTCPTRQPEGGYTVHGICDYESVRRRCLVYLGMFSLIRHAFWLRYSIIVDIIFWA
jgi:hypothetical protein